MTITFHLNEFWLAILVFAVICWAMGVSVVRQLYRWDQKCNGSNATPAIVWGLAWIVCPIWLAFYGLHQAVKAMPLED